MHQLIAEDLRMGHEQIQFKNSELRLFNGRGAISPRLKTVTGLHNVRFTPIDVSHYQFSLAFRERRTGALIQDVMGEMDEYRVWTGGDYGLGIHPLGTNREQFVRNEQPGYAPHSAIAPQLFVIQDAYWQPNLYYRRGNYHKELDGKWISCRLETESSVSGRADELYMKVKMTNRESVPLEFTVIPVQNIVNPLVLDNHVISEKIDAFAIRGLTNDGQPVVFAVSSDLHPTNDEGWTLVIPERSSVEFHVVIRFGREASVQSSCDPDIQHRVAQADRDLRGRISRMAHSLPKLSVDYKPLEEYYNRCIHTVLECMWEREDFFLERYYSSGTWISTMSWDVSFASRMLAVTDPEGLKQVIAAYARLGIFNCSWIRYNGYVNPQGDAYLQSLFSLVTIIRDYAAQTGDHHILLTEIGEGTLFDSLVQSFMALYEQYARQDGLLDLGAASNNLLEARTDGYKHVVSGINGIAGESLLQMADWCSMLQHPEESFLRDWATRIGKAMNEQMWDNEQGWFHSLYPDGSRHLVWAYHLYDFIESGLLSGDQRDSMVGHLREGMFLGRYGMYSMAKEDELHFDYEDVDWAGGGQFIGMPNKISESLYRLGYGEKAWDILKRCTKWAERYPYFPQEIYTESLEHPGIEMPLQISAGAGVQAVLFGIFGLRPQANGSLVIRPSYHDDLGDAALDGYRFRGHTYRVELGKHGYKVYRDGMLIAMSAYDQTAYVDHADYLPEGSGNTGIGIR